MASHYPPAPGASGGERPRLATLQAPPYTRLDKAECDALGKLKDQLCAWIYLLLCMHADFQSGELLTSYARLIALSTPPKPERGRARLGPSYWQMRRAIDDLERARLVVRHEYNEAQGQLRLYIRPRDSRTAPDALARRRSRRVF